MRPATEAQKKFAEAIAKELSIDLPKEVTRQSLFIFIRDNRPAFDKCVANSRTSSGRAGNYGLYGREVEFYEGQDDRGPYGSSDLEMECYGLDPYTGGFADD